RCRPGADWAAATLSKKDLLKIAWPHYNMRAREQDRLRLLLQNSHNSATLSFESFFPLMRFRGPSQHEVRKIQFAPECGTFGPSCVTASLTPRNEGGGPVPCGKH